MLRKAKKAAIAALTALAVLFGILVASPAIPAQADGVWSCDSAAFANLSWQTASWGRAKYCEIDGVANDGVTDGGVGFMVQTEDTYTDGYCVKVQYYRLGAWYDVANSQSCGAAVTSSWANTNFDVTYVRLIRGPTTSPYSPGVGVNYKTLYDI